MKPLKKYNKYEALAKVMKYCAYQERCHQEVKEKLFGWGLFSDEVDEILAELIEQNFINEERFASAFVRGKFNQKKWGRNKIAFHLKQKGVSDNLIRISLQELDETAYEATLQDIIQKKSKHLHGEKAFIKKGKLANFAVSKGYESELVWRMINELESE